MEGKSLLAWVDKDKRKIVRACRFHVSTYGFISFCLMAARNAVMRCCISSVCGWSPPFLAWALGIFSFVNSYCWAYTKFDNRNNQFQTQEHNYKYSPLNYRFPSWLVLCWYLPMSWCVTNNATKLAVTSLENDMYTMHVACILLAFSGGENVRVKYVLHVWGL